VWRIVLGDEPLTPEALVIRRKNLVEFLGQAVFRDRQRGAEFAARVLADTPMPEAVFQGRKPEGKLTARVLADAPRPEIQDGESLGRKR
jgi:hypothetical protein